MIPASHAHVRLLVLLAVGFGMAALGAAPAQAQGVAPSLPPLADLSISVEYDHGQTVGVSWIVTVKNSTVGGHPGTDVADVRVRMVLGAANDANSPYETRSWMITNLPAGGSEEHVFRAPRADGVNDGPAKVAQRFYAEIIESDPAEPERLQSNNTVEHWAIFNRREGVSRFATGDAGVRVYSVSDRSPQRRGATTFTVEAFNSTFGQVGSTRHLQDSTQLNVQVKISLSPGLKFAPSARQQRPTRLNPNTLMFEQDTTFNRNTGIWDVGTMEDKLRLPVTVDLTTDTLADLPLESRCLTAKVVRAEPWFASDPRRRQNDAVTVCLGELGEDRKMLLVAGVSKDQFRFDITLFDFYPCVGNTSDPCTSADTLELLATIPEELTGITVWRPGRHLTPGPLLQPDTFVLQLEDNSRFSRHSDGRTPSYAAARQGMAGGSGLPIWSTSLIFDLIDSQTRLTASKWNDGSLREDVTVTGPNGGPLPGAFTMDYGDFTVKATDHNKSGWRFIRRWR